MIKYYVTFLGNDTFQSSYSIEAENFSKAVGIANDMLPDVQGHTIELVRVGSIEESEHFALDRVNRMLS